MTRPSPNLAVRLHRIDEVTPAVLQRDRISMIVEHLGDEVHGVRVERQARVVDDPESVELVTERSFRDDELGGVGAAVGGVRFGVEVFEEKERTRGNLEGEGVSSSPQASKRAPKLTDAVGPNHSRLEQRRRPIRRSTAPIPSANLPPSFPYQRTLPRD